MDKMPNSSGDHVTLRLDEKLFHLSHLHLECYIGRVLDRLRKQNKEAYEPEILSIGPYYHGKGNLKSMEEHKLYYLRHLVERRKERSVERYVAAMRDLQERTFRCYSHPISLEKDEFVEMMLLDSCFVVELFRKFTITRMKDMHDPLFKRDWIHICIWRDLLLFENQLPLFVLMQLFNMTKVPDPQDNFVDLVMRYYYLVWRHYHYSVSPGPMWFFRAPTEDVKHVLGLVHTIGTSAIAKLISERNVGYEKKTWDYINCATELQDAGIKFKRANHDTPFHIKFKNGTLEIPQISVDDQTESIIRNAIAYEQHLQDDSPKYVTDYLTFLCCLINSSKDVSLLRRYGILNNMLGDDEAVSAVCSKAFTCVFASRDGFCYSDVFNDVNTYCRRRRNIWKANLRRNYFNSPWTIISFLGALLLLILTLAQTLLSSFSYFARTKC